MRKKFITVIALFSIHVITKANPDSVTFTRSLFYPNDQFELAKSQKDSLGFWLKKIENQTDFSIDVKGYTDLNGSDIYNQNLSQKRSKEVVSFFLKNKIGISKITQSSFGEKFAQNELNKENFLKYRRVDVCLKWVANNSISAFLNKLNPSPNQLMTLKSDSAYSLKGVHGTLVEIPANSFVFEDGSPCNGVVNFELKEAVDLPSIISFELETTSDGKDLITRGMVYIDATCEGKKVNLAKDKTIQVTLPSKKSSEETMNLFYGEKTANGAINWKQDSIQIFQKKPKLIPIDIDKTALRNLKITVPPKPILQKFSEKLVIPIKPPFPYIPKEPALPKASNCHYFPTAFEKLFISKKKLASKGDTLFQRELSKYEIRLAKHQNKMAKVPAKMEKYRIACEKYHQDSVEFECKVNERIKAVLSYFQDANKYIRQNGLKNLCIKIDQSTITSQTNFMRLLQNSSDPISVDKKLAVLESTLGKEIYLNHFCREKHTHSETCTKEILYGSSELFAFKTQQNSSEVRDVLNEMQTHLLDSLRKKGLLKSADIDGFVATVGNLGWINCDRFSNVAANKKTAPIVSESGNAVIYLISKSQSGIFKLYNKGQACYPIAVPIIGDYKVVGIKIVEGKPLFAFRDFYVIPKEKIDLEYKEGSMELLKNELKNVAFL